MATTGNGSYWLPLSYAEWLYVFGVASTELWLCLNYPPYGPRMGRLTIHLLMSTSHSV